LFMRFMQLPVGFHLSSCLRQPFELIRMNQRMALRTSHGPWRERLSALFARTDQRRFGYGQALSG